MTSGRIAAEAIFQVKSRKDPMTAENLFEPRDRQVIRPGQWEPDLEPLEVKAFRFEPTEQDR